ncbi:SRPBCC family protein [Bdellovibrio sp. NC01]|uniref:SRPBCC family protein n=1 Tax=Bdellovibrio sp. NC01 TaxID=2220073 RepID=UPI00115B9531|nr:SRPBCC family protein [Bdellovibrio sp. NC01]QDK39325.1 hypothetical protein DOE51_17850 [Bdellovibrio sp. NC01]
MIKIVGLVVVALLVIFIVFIATRAPHFHYERSGVINAPAEKIFPYLSTFQGGHAWSPFERIDPNMKMKVIGDDGKVGTVMEFDGNKDAGSGKLEILKITPSTEVDMRLIMVKPFPADNLIEYRLTPEGTGTKLTWSMSGENGFFGKMITVFIDCDKMIGDQMNQGIKNLKEVVER